MAVVVQGSIEGNSLTISTYLKGEPIETEERVRIGGAVRIDEPRWDLPPLWKEETSKTEERRFVLMKLLKFRLKFQPDHRHPIP
jgi:hypothetical protein